MRTTKWQVVGAAIEDTRKTVRLCVILVVMSVCTVGPLILTTWFLATHGYPVEAIARAVVRALSR